MGYPTTRSAAYFLERAGIFPTPRHPVPAASPDTNPVHAYPLVPPPYPLPALLRGQNGCPPPDRGQSDIWPWGEAGELPA
jgi:hypothetical protein